MRVTQTLLRQHIGWHFKKHWQVQGKRKIINTDAEKVLAQKGVPICKPQELFKETRTYEKVDVVGFGVKPTIFDETHPNWHARTLLTYKDNNVLLEGITQAKILTKSVELREGLPDSIVFQDLSKDINKLCKKIILNTHVFDAEQKKLPIVKDPSRPAWNFPRTYGITQERVNKLITSKLLQLIETTSDYNLVKERYIFNDLFYSFPFERQGDIIQFQLRGDTVICSTKPLSPVTSESTEHLSLPDISPIKHTITLNEENIYELEDIYPISKSTNKSHPHTIIVHYDKEEVKNLFAEEVTESQIFGRSLLKTFTVAAAYARQKFGNDVKTLPQPFSLQCIQTDGKTFHFGILQLNTLDMDENSTKNIWYQTATIPLFERCCYDVGKPVLEGYNSDVIKHLYAFYKNV